MANEYWVYHNITAVAGGKAIIHHKDCSFCNDGMGVHRVLSVHGEWLGPTSTPRRVAMKTGAKTIRECSFCGR